MNSFKNYVFGIVKNIDEKYLYIDIDNTSIILKYNKKKINKRIFKNLGCYKLLLKKTVTNTNTYYSLLNNDIITKYLKQKKYIDGFIKLLAPITQDKITQYINLDYVSVSGLINKIKNNKVVDIPSPWLKKIQQKYIPYHKQVNLFFSIKNIENYTVLDIKQTLTGLKKTVYYKTDNIFYIKSAIKNIKQNKQYLKTQIKRFKIHLLDI